jgi:hypothetical protein
MFLLAAGPLAAEGLHFEAGRFDGPVVELRLTPEQNRLVTCQYRKGMTLRLTPSQRAEIRAKAGLKVAPTRVEVYLRTHLQGECTCFASNYAIPFSPGLLELPVKLLCSDREAALNVCAD